MTIAEEVMLRYVAEVSVGASTTQSYRRANAEFTYGAFLSRLNLRTLASKNEAEFQRWLNRQTTRLSRNIQPIKNTEVATWGMARKILNIFLHNIYYNRVLCDLYHLEDIEQYLEVPLDSHVVCWLLRIAESTHPEIDFKNPIAGSFKVYKVSKSVNADFQRLATQAAKQVGTTRVFLDPYLYRAKEKIWIYRDRMA